MFIFLKTMSVVVMAVLFIVVLVYSLVYLKYKFVLDIKGKTIRMQKPFVSVERKSVFTGAIHENLILKEAILRKSAYKNTPIKTDKSFFDDSDMKSDYYLIIIYHKKLNIPLLTGRYYFDKSVIAKCLKEDNNSESLRFDFGDMLDLNKFKEGELFLADRLSGNITSSIYRQYRSYIHLLFYLELFSYNKNCKFIIMARKEKLEKLLKNYLRWGLKIVGFTKHKEKEHWILLGDLKKHYSQTKTSTILNIILVFKRLLIKLNNNIL